MVLTELEPRFSAKENEIICALGNVCHSETPDTESFFRDAKFYKIDDEILEAEKKMYAISSGEDGRLHLQLEKCRHNQTDRTPVS